MTLGELKRATVHLDDTTELKIRWSQSGSGENPYSVVTNFVDGETTIIIQVSEN